MLCLEGSVAAGGLPPADFLVKEVRAVPAPDYLVVSMTTAPRPTGDGWNWDAGRKTWWRPAPQSVTYSGGEFYLGPQVTFQSQVCGPNGCPPTTQRRFLRR